MICRYLGRFAGKLLVALCLVFIATYTGWCNTVTESAAAPVSLWFAFSGAWIRGSVALGDLDGDGIDDVVVGGTDGRVYAYNGTGDGLLWTYDTYSITGKRAAIEGKAAIGDINLDGHNEVLIGVGSTFTPSAPGGMWALRYDGAYLWHQLSGDFNEDGVPDGVQCTPSLVDVDLNDGGKLEVVYGGFDAHIRALNHDGTTVWSLFTRDTIWSSPAVGDLDLDGKPEIVIGSDAHLEPAFGTVDGGKLYALNGENGTFVPGFFRQVDEVVWSAPALGDINGDGWLEIVVGTGDCYEHSACASGGRTHPVTDALYAFDRFGNPLPGWPIQLSEFALASPTLADLDLDGDLEIIINTGDAYVHAFHGNGGRLSGWPRQVTTPAGPDGQVVHYPTHASPVVADLTGDGRLEVILPSNWEIVVWDWTGQQLTRSTCCPVPVGKWSLDTSYTLYGTPAVGDVDGDGQIELIAAGGTAGGANGALYRWDYGVTSAGLAGVWSRFRFSNVNHGRYPMMGRFEGPPHALLVLHEYGDGSSEQLGWWMSNGGDGQIAWSVSSRPANVSVTPSTGLLGSTNTWVTVEISASGYQKGYHELGDIVLTGTVAGQPAENSPVRVPVTLFVGDVQHAFLPLVRIAGQ